MWYYNYPCRSHAGLCKKLAILEAQVTALEKGSEYKGEWVIATAYVTDETVIYCGKPYLALADSTGIKPGTNPSVWSEICY